MDLKQFWLILCPTTFETYWLSFQQHSYQKLPQITEPALSTWWALAQRDDEIARRDSNIKQWLTDNELATM